MQLQKLLGTCDVNKPSKFNFCWIVFRNIKSCSNSLSRKTRTISPHVVTTIAADVRVKQELQSEYQVMEDRFSESIFTGEYWIFLHATPECTSDGRLIFQGYVCLWILNKKLWRACDVILMVAGDIQQSKLNTLRPRQNGRHISDDTFKPISWMNVFEFRLKFHLSLFLSVLLTIFQHWFW